MEIEAALPPPNIRFEKICNAYALRILKFQKDHLIRQVITKLDNRDKLGLDPREADSRIFPSIRYTTVGYSQLGDLAARISGLQDSWNIEELNQAWLKPWQRAIEANFRVPLIDKQQEAKNHKLAIQNTDFSRQLVYYTDGSKEGELNAAAFCQIGVNSQILAKDNFNLGNSVEIADCELFAVYKALSHIEQTNNNPGKDAYIYIDSQAAIRKL